MHVSMYAQSALFLQGLRGEGNVSRNNNGGVVRHNLLP